MGYILFSSEDNVSIQAKKNWNGILEYSYNNKTWYQWNGRKIINNKIYMRGFNNSAITEGESWIINGKNIRCQGNIENLLNYSLVTNGIHPTIISSLCFANMFRDCTTLIEAPQLLSICFSDYCYAYMFCGCTSLTTSPMFPNLTIAKKVELQKHMFDNCPIQTVNVNNKLYDINVFKLL